MRSTFFFAALLVAVASAALVVARNRDEPATGVPWGTVTLVGDSLAHPDWLASDGLHGNEVGYRERARAVAKAAKGCAPAQIVTER